MSVKKNFACIAPLLAAIGAFGLRSACATPLVTGGLFVDLDGSNLGDPGSPVAVWVDKATDLSNGTIQDFGQENVGNRPTVASVLMPNNSIHKVVDFNRGTVSGSGSSTSGSQYLVSNLNGATGAFAAGGDPAYQLGGTAGDDGLSFFIVYQSDVTTNPTGGGNVARQGRQTMFTSNHDGGMSNSLVVATGGDDSDGVPNHFSQIRGEGPGFSGLFAGESDITPNWYISAISWDLDSGDALSRHLQHDGTDTGNLPIADAGWTSAFGAHLQAILGQAADSTGTGNRAFDGRIAELLIYNSALSEADMNGVVSYLNAKYFVPEPGSIVMASFGLIAMIGCCRRGRRKAA